MNARRESNGAARPGRRNLVTDVPGIEVGNATDSGARTGVTVVLPTARAVGGVDARGGAPGTRETDALRAENLVEAIDAIVLAGGSVYGLAAADSVTAWLGAQGRGYGLAPSSTGAPRSPVVPAAILFDLANGGDKAWGEDPPYRALGRDAAAAASARFELGSVGAGAGATAGAIKGGLGSASIVTADGFTVGAIAAVNSFGSVVASGSRAFWAAPYEIDGEFGGVPLGLAKGLPDGWGLARRSPAVGENTTIACVATDVALTPAQARRLAIMAQDGLARAVRPAHAPFDGDVIFAISTARRDLGGDDYLLTRLGALAADCLARAIARGVYEAAAWPGSGTAIWRDLGPTGKLGGA
jgi:L-aminopeptidase/D-esterase-like protein